MLSFTWIELIFITTSSIFIFLVVIQANVAGSSGGLNSTNSTSNRVPLITKISGVLAIIVFSLTLYMNYENKKISNPITPIIGESLND
jgi:preprotein translocase subunit SecG